MRRKPWNGNSAVTVSHRSDPVSPRQQKPAHKKLISGFKTNCLRTRGMLSFPLWIQTEKTEIGFPQQCIKQRKADDICIPPFCTSKLHFFQLKKGNFSKQYWNQTNYESGFVAVEPIYHFKRWIFKKKNYKSHFIVLSVGFKDVRVAVVLGLQWKSSSPRCPGTASAGRCWTPSTSPPQSQCTATNPPRSSFL